MKANNSLQRRNKQKKTPIYKSPGNLIKYWDFNNWGLSIGTTPQYFEQLLPAQGTAQGQRIANDITLLNYELRAQFVQVNTDLWSTVRMTLFIWHPYTNSDTPTSDDLYKVTAHPDVSQFNWESRHRYTVIKDWIIPLVGSSTSLTTSSVVTLTYKTSLAGRRVVFNESAQTGAGLLYLAVTSNSVAPPFPVADFSGRCFYMDA